MLGSPLLQRFAAVAADHTSNRWAACGEKLHLFDAEREMLVMSWPAGLHTCAAICSRRTTLCFRERRLHACFPKPMLHHHAC